MNLPNLGLELTWTGKTAAQRVARQTPFHALAPVSAHGTPGSGRWLVLAYKGGHLVGGVDADEKQRIGQRWAATSQGQRCLFVEVSKADPLKRSLDKQLRDVVGHVSSKISL